MTMSNKLLFILCLMLAPILKGQSNLANSLVNIKDSAMRISLSVKMTECYRSSVEKISHDPNLTILVCAGFARVTGTDQIKLRADILNFNNGSLNVVLDSVEGVFGLSEDFDLQFKNILKTRKTYTISKDEFKWFIKQLSAIPMVRPKRTSLNHVLLGGVPDTIVLYEEGGFVIRQSSGNDYWGAPLFIAFNDKLKKIKK